MASSGNDFQAQLDKMLEKQKTARINNEHFVSVTILKDIISLCHSSHNWQKLYEMINYLMNRRGQGKKGQIQMIQLAMTWLPAMQEPQRTKLIETIRDVCAKKIFLEVEYARCILMIVKSKESDNDIMEAASILQEVQVETYGSMDKRQKLEFILYQMKIMLKKKDMVRLFIISKKINENNINDDEIADIKIMYYSYMAIYWNNENRYKECTRCYRVIWETLKSTKKIVPEQLDFGFSSSPNNVLYNYVGFLALQPFSAETTTELQKLSLLEQLEKHTDLVHLITSFLSEQIISCDISTYSADNFELFRDQYASSKVKFPLNQNHRLELKRMLVQHNIRVISKYYGQLTLNRVSQLLKVEKEFCEEELCTLNNKKVISCRIDRIDDVIDFKPVENESYLLENWNSSINNILDLVDVASNLINREREVYKK